MKGSRRLADAMIAYFEGYDGSEGIPSYEKFAATVGTDGEELLRLSRESAAFGRAYRRCAAIRRDRLIDAALLRRYDPSFCKYLLDTLEATALGGGEDAPLEVEVRIV